MEAVGSMVMDWLSNGIYAVLAFAVGSFVTYARAARKRQTATEKGMRVLLRRELRIIHAKAMKQGYISYEDEADAEETYSAYHGNGGNGSGTAMIEDIENLPMRG